MSAETFISLHAATWITSRIIFESPLSTSNNWFSDCCIVTIVLWTQNNAALHWLVVSSCCNYQSVWIHILCVHQPESFRRLCVEQRWAILYLLVVQAADWQNEVHPSPLEGLARPGLYQRGDCLDRKRSPSSPNTNKLYSSRELLAVILGLPPF